MKLFNVSQFSENKNFIRINKSQDMLGRERPESRARRFQHISWQLDEQI